MPVDSSIALGVRPPQFADPLQQYGNVLAIQNAGNQNALSQYTLARAKREDEDTNALRRELAGVGSMDSPEGLRAAQNALMRVGRVKEAQELGKSMLDREKTMGEINKQKIDQAFQHLDMVGRSLANVQTDEQALSIIDSLTKTVPQQRDAVLAQYTASRQSGKSPQQVAQEIAASYSKHALDKIKAFAPDIDFQNLGGTVGAMNKNPLAGTIGPMAGVAEIAKTVTPDAALQRSTQVSEGALNRGVQVRGQNMLDTRSRENAALVDNRMRLNAGLTDTGGLTAESEAMARGIASGQLAPLSSFALNRPGGRAVMSRVMELNPEYSAKDYAVGLNGIKGFTTGKQGDVVRSFNVGISHLNTLEELADALQNGDVQAVNKAGNFIAKQTGAPAPTNFNAAKQIVADEIVKAVIGGRGALGDRQEAAKTISDASSPEQLKGVIRTYKSLMNGQLQGLKQQYEQSTGRKDFDRFLMTQEGASSATTGKPAKPTANDFFRN